MRFNSKSKHNKRRAFAEKPATNLLWFAPLIIIPLLVIGLWLAKSPFESAKGMQLQATPFPVNSGLAYLETSHSGNSKIKHRPQPLGNEDSTIAEPFIPAGCSAMGMYASPHGPWLAIDVTCEASGFVLVINVASGRRVDLDPVLTQKSTFLNWSPTGNEIILRAGSLPNSRIYTVQVNSGNYEQLPVPGNVYDVALSVNRNRMVYSLTKGLGHGSETWIADINGRNARRVLREQNHIIAFTHWSPSGSEITYIRMPDSDTPFTVGELWVIDTDGQNPVLLGNADAGHGYRPAWSPDGHQIAFVVREQPGGEANHDADKLVSNIYMVNLTDKNLFSVTNFDGALTETPVWSPDGEFLAFTTTAGGSGTDLWVLEKRNNQLSQVTHGLNARYPTWLSTP